MDISTAEVGTPRPALTSIADAAAYLSLSRATFYRDVIPHIETVRIGKRHLVLVESLDRFISAHRDAA